jgi:hypothetical protein
MPTAFAKETTEIVDRHRKICIAKEPPITRRFVHSPSNGSAFATVRSVDEANVSVGRRYCRNNLGSRIG